MTKERKTVKKLKCDVIACAYNDGKSGCTARQISVGTQNAKDCKDTVCATFKNKDK